MGQEHYASLLFSLVMTASDLNERNFCLNLSFSKLSFGIIYNLINLTCGLKTESGAGV